MLCGNTQRSIQGFSPNELWWLGQELSDFLNVELQSIYPTIFDSESTARTILWRRLLKLVEESK
jgi:hypothetical protein